jgi:hypothetical protein
VSTKTGELQSTAVAPDPTQGDSSGLEVTDPGGVRAATDRGQRQGCTEEAPLHTSRAARYEQRMRLAIVVLALVASCTDSSRCRERCPVYGMDAPQCERLCTSSCDELVRDFGMNRETCEAMQRGESVGDRAE